MAISEIQEELVCPHCNGELYINSNKASCCDCERDFPRTKSGQIDFRLQNMEMRTMQVEIGNYNTYKDANFERTGNKRANVNEVDLPQRMSPKLFSHIPVSGDENDLVLDLGCGSDTIQFAVEQKGYNWIGVDIEGEEADILADAHSLPFKSNTFSVSVSLRVLEHLQYPLLALFEVKRVTKPNGLFCGNVAFIEPYHGNSVFHHSPTGVLSSLETAGFNVKQISPDGNGFLHIGVRMYPILPDFLSRAILFFPYLLHRLWYFTGQKLLGNKKSTEEYRQVRFARGFEFVAVPNS